MKVISILILTFLVTNLFAQSRSLVNLSNGDIFTYDNNCCLKFYEKFPIFNDIAFGEDKIYGVNDKLHIIDFNSKQIIDSFPLYNTNGVQIYSDGLEIVNDSLLFLDDETDLYCFNLNSNTIQSVGNMGYYCSGDFLMLNNKLYMTTDSNELIEITFSSSYTIANVSVVDLLPVNSVYGLSKTVTPNELLLFSGVSAYNLNLVQKEYHEVCNLNSAINGASYLGKRLDENNFPNILTPNGDNINAFIDLSQLSSFSILNRWGQEVFNNNCSNIWRGENKSGDFLNEGVYYIIIHFEDCETIKSFCQNITILK